ncbi:MAG: hypothetical protein K2H86_00535 [Muribaculaceae bacterium]|nr:hypothetical protein [Muribaculaceae bacterium]
MNVLEFVKHKASLMTLWLSVGTVMGGTAAAVIRGNMEVLPAILCLLFGIFAQLTANFYHAWYVQRSKENKVFAKESVIYEDENDERGNPFKVRVLREASTSAFLISAVVGLGLLAITHQPWWFLLMGAFIYGQFLLLHLGKKPLINTPLSMVCTFLVFGPVGVISTGLIQSQAEAHGSIWAFFDTAPCLFIGGAVGFMALTVHYIFSYANYISGPGYNKFNLTRLVGPTMMVLMTFLNGLFMFGLMVWMVLALHISDPLIALVPAFIGLLLNSVVAIMMNRRTISNVKAMFKLSVWNYVLTFALMLLLFWVIAPPDDSYRLLF